LVESQVIQGGLISTLIRTRGVESHLYVTLM